MQLYCYSDVCPSRRGRDEYGWQNKFDAHSTDASRSQRQMPAWWNTWGDPGVGDHAAGAEEDQLYSVSTAQADVFTPIRSAFPPEAQQKLLAEGKWPPKTCVSRRSAGRRRNYVERECVKER